MQGWLRILVATALGSLCCGVLGCGIGLAMEGPARTHPNDGAGIIALAGLSAGLVLGMMAGALCGVGWHLLHRKTSRNRDRPSARC